MNELVERQELSKQKINVLPNGARPIMVSLWFMQAIFWGVLTVVTFFSLTLWYGSAEMPHVIHTLAQSLIGFLLTYPMRAFYRNTWQKNAFQIAFTIAAVVTVFASIWSVLRMAAFIWLTTEGPELWQDFGGWYFSGFFIFLCWTAVYYSMRYYRMATDEKDRRVKLLERSRSEKLKRLRAEKIATESRMQMLRYQLNPHFLFNTLNAVNSLIVSQELKEARATVESLSSFLRYALKDEDKGLVDLDGELNALGLYLNIEKIRFADRLNVSYDIAEEARSFKLPSLLLQPLVENTIKHAINVKEQGCTIEIKARIESGALHLEVNDNGPGILHIKAGQLSREDIQFSGVGIKNIFDRLDSLYGNLAEVTLFNKPEEGLSVRIRISGSVNSQ